MKLNETNAIGLGCMNLSHAYGEPVAEADAIKLLNEALDLGYNHLDTAALYGLGANETVIGNAIAHRREEFFLASKCVLVPNSDGQREIDARPERIRQTCEDALKRLQTDFIDLYYLHRYDKKVPIEDSVGALADLVAEGKIGAIGLSEMSAQTLRRAHKIHPIAAMQTEYSLWTRNADIAVIEACAELGTTFVAFSPLARGYLGGELTDVTQLVKHDLRRTMPRFYPENYPRNLALLSPIQTMAQEMKVTTAQLALAWVLKRAPHIVAIPGTTSLKHLHDNFNALTVNLSDAQWQQLNNSLDDKKVFGTRYTPDVQLDIDTEEFF